MKWMHVMLLALGLCLAGTVAANDGGHGGGGGAGNFMPMDPIIVNVKVGEGSGYLNFTPQLKLRDPADGEYIKSYTPVLRHLLLKSLVGQSATTMQTAEFIGSYSHKAAELINQALDGDYVSEVLFDRWLIQ